MSGKDGAQPGEVCAICAEPMNVGYKVCSACNAVRELNPTALTYIASFSAAISAWIVVAALSNGIFGFLAAFIVFVVGLIVSRQNIVYRKRIP